MRPLLVSSLAPLIAAAACAQVVPQATLAATNVFAGTSSAPPLLSGTPVWPGFARSVFAGADSASLLVSHAVDTASVDVHWQLSVQAVANGACTAAGEVLYELSSPVPQVGHLIVEYSASVAGTGQHALAIDLHDDGSVDAQAGVVVPVVFGPQSLFVRVQAEVTAQAGTVGGPWGSAWSWTGTAAADLSLRFAASHATVATLQASACWPTAAFAARPNFAQGVDLDASAPGGDELVVFVLGAALQPVPLALPAPALPGCSLLVVPSATPWLPLGPGGTATLGVPVPLAVRPASFLAQAVTLDLESLRLTASAALRIDVP